MNEPTSKRHWRRRWVWAAGVVWLAVAYPVSLWPVAYLVGRGWVGKAQATAFYGPAISAANHLTPRPTYKLVSTGDGRTAIRVVVDRDSPRGVIGKAAEGYLDVAEWFADLGHRHATGE